MVIGFDGYKSEDHACMTSCMIKVGEGKEGYDVIVNAFATRVIGGYVRRFVANPLHEALPCLVVVAHCTCNCFDALFV